MSKPLEECSREELVEIVKSQRETIVRTKKFGLVWEDKPEKVATDCAKKLPIIKEESGKAISKATDSEPTNIIIEGDNYHALSVLNYTHAGKIDVIYIDPPYNTGNASWRYNNKIIDSEDSFRHSKFISFLDKRLRLAKNLLSENGIIAVAIDDYEVHTVRFLLDEIFGEKARLGTIVVVHNPRGRNDDKYFATMHEYTLFYSPGPSPTIHKFDRTQEELDKEFPYSDEISSYGLVSFMRTGNNSDRQTRPNMYFPLYIGPNNEISVEKIEGWDEVFPINPKGREKTWRWYKKTVAERTHDILVKRTAKGITLYKKRRPEIVGGKKPKTVWYDSRYDASSHGINLIEKILNKKNVFPYPKSFYAMVDILSITTNKDSIVLDFFAGSGTTGHAVMELNKQDGGHRQFILCTNNENNIAEEVTYQRIKGVIDGYADVDGIPANLRYFKTDFVDKNGTMDKLRRELSPACQDMIRLREGAYEIVIDDDMLKVFKNARGLTAVIYDRFELKEYIKKIEALETDSPVHLYVFSYSKSDRSDEMPENLRHKYESQPIPEGVLEIYKRIFANIKGGKNA